MIPLGPKGAPPGVIHWVTATDAPALFLAACGRNPNVHPDTWVWPGDDGTPENLVTCPDCRVWLAARPGTEWT